MESVPVVRLPVSSLKDVDHLWNVISQLGLTSEAAQARISSLYHRELFPVLNRFCFFPFQVFVWIHGGGLAFGSASPYDGSALAAFDNVVVVTIQYRLGIAGYFR